MKSLNSLTVFCDDARRELYNKITLVGLYNHLLVVDRTPIFDEKDVQPLLPKLVAFTTLNFKNDLIGKKVTMLYHVGGHKKPLSHEVVLEGEQEILSSLTKGPNFMRTQYVVANLQDIPLPKDGTSEISVFVKYEKKKILSGKILTVVKEGVAQGLGLPGTNAVKKKKSKTLK